MNCDRVREQLPVLLDHRLTTAAASEIRAHLDGCAGCRDEFSDLSQTLAALDAMPAPTPSPRLRAKVYAAIAAEQHTLRAATPVGSSATTNAAPKRRTWVWLMQSLGAAALLALGFGLGTRSAPSTQTGSPLPSASTDLATQRELAALRAKVDSMGQLVGYSLLQQQSRSPNERLHGILTSANLANPDNRAINDLISALALDPSTNVRLNALEALYPHADQEVVRAGVLTSLPREQSPLVQVSMIDFLVAARDREAGPVFQKLSDNTLIDGDVRAAAKRALNQL